MKTIQQRKSAPMKRRDVLTSAGCSPLRQIYSITSEKSNFLPVSLMDGPCSHADKPEAKRPLSRSAFRRRKASAAALKLVGKSQNKNGKKVQKGVASLQVRD